ncbi:MAG: nucleotidyl transferase AbiEii/AbiGii toxin family protein [Acidobacteria bacterium]|nr:nucleotidyl transferase AbiEii/AbiGii toxin family protein [Acidobacteriota bacterium]
MKRRRYATPAAFKHALEQRLKSSSETGTAFARRRQLLVFERFLARVAEVAGDSVVLKGGLVLELRLTRARTTRDIDLRMSGSSENVLERLQEAGRLDLGDYMRFEVRPDPSHPEIRTEAMQYDGFRFRAECQLAGAIYGQPFGVDVAFGDPLVGEVQLIVGEDLLAFAGISPPRVQVYPVPSHIAEKLHAFTMPRERPNSRVRDLPDLALLAKTGPIRGVELRLALQRTFEFRQTHPLPPVVPAAPDLWERPYAKLAEENRLEWGTLRDLDAAVAAFLDPVLGAGLIGGWNPALWQWE